MTLDFWKAALVRAVRTAAQTALTYITIGAVAKDIDWLAMLSAAGVGAVYSLLTSIVTGLPEAETAGTLYIRDDTDKMRMLFTADGEPSDWIGKTSVRLKVDSSGEFPYPHPDDVYEEADSE